MKTYQKVTAKIMKSTGKTLTEGEKTRQYIKRSFTNDNVNALLVQSTFFLTLNKMHL